MGSLKREITGTNPELRTLIDVFEKAAYRHSYYDTFRDFIDYCIHEYTAPENPLIRENYKFPNTYSETETAYFKTMLNEVQNLCYERCRLWNRRGGWYDPFGTLFENVSSNFSKQSAGQFFTPPAVCDLMAKMIIEEPTAHNVGGTVVDPCCGSGRLLLASSEVNPGLYHIANDIDALCCKMTAVNFCLNGVIGEISCNDGLMSTASNFRFAYKVVPLMCLFNDELLKMIFALNPAYHRQFCILPLEYEKCMIQQAEPEKKEFFIQHVQTHVEHRNEIHPEGLQGVLFEAEKITKERREKLKSTPKTRTSVEEKLNLLLNI